MANLSNVLAGLQQRWQVMWLVRDVLSGPLRSIDAGCEVGVNVSVESC